MVKSLWQTAWRVLKILKMESPHDPIIPLLDIYPKELKAGDMCIPTFIAALLTITKRWGNPNVHRQMGG